MRVRYTATALNEASEILAQIAADNPAAATAVATALQAAVARLRTFPRLGAETDMPGIRVQIAVPYRYLVFYRIGSNAIVVRNIRHPARQHPGSPIGEA